MKASSARSIMLMVAVVFLTAAECKSNPKMGDSNPRPSITSCQDNTGGCPMHTYNPN
jgi:hypothetical protein